MRKLAPWLRRSSEADERTGVNGAKYLYRSIESQRQSFVFIFIYKSPELKKGKKKKTRQGDHLTMFACVMLL